MTGHRCIVFGCNDRPRTSGKSVAYHMFPTNNSLREMWIKRCGRHEQFNADRSYVCSAHFKEEDYEKDLQAESSWPKKCILKSAAIPTLNLGSWSLNTRNGFNNEVISTSGSNNQGENIIEVYMNDKIKKESESGIHQIEVPGYGERDIKIEEVDVVDHDLPANIEEESKMKIEELHIEEDSGVIGVNEGTETDIEDADMEDVSAEQFKVFVSDGLVDSGESHHESSCNTNTTRFAISENPSGTMKYQLIVRNRNRLLHRVKELENELIVSQSLVAKLKEKVTSLEYELHKAKEQTVEDIQLKEGIGDVLSKSQINYGVLKKKKVRWSSDDVSKAFTIRYFSSRCYMYLRDTLKYPLPGMSSLQRWVSKINMQEGVLSGILRIMKIAGYAMTDFEKTTVLHVDEIKVRSLYEYDEIQDEILGPYSTMQVMMARGLFSDWKQPIYIGFDRTITKKSLLDVVEKLHDATYNVVACVWNGCSITNAETSIAHPITDEKIYFFVDASHLLVLIYNSLMETGLTLDDGTIITKQSLQQNVFGLSRKGSGLEELQKPNLELAKKVFSHEHAMVLQNLENKPAVRAGMFVEKISSWFELMTNSNVLMKRLYGCDLVHQNEILDSTYDMIETMRCTTKDDMDTFQKGVLISIKSLKQLFNDMQIRYSVKHILTCRLNLDSLEDLLSQVRVGENNHPLPSPLSLIYKIRNLVLGNCINQNSSKEVVKNEYILSKVLTANISLHNPSSKTIEEGDLKMLLSFTEKDQLKYLAALIATKFKDKYPELVDDTAKKRKYILPFWLQHLSCGDLTKASTYWLTQMKHMDKMFIFHHGVDGVLKKSTKKNVTKRLVNYVTKRYRNVFPLEIISEFVRQRTLVRIMHCNIKLTCKTKRKNTGSNNMKVKKM